MQEDIRPLNSLADVEEFNRIARSLERSEMRHTGRKLLPAREEVARRIRITDDQIENYRSGRTKIVPHWLMRRIRAELISVLGMEVLNLEHEINLHRQIGADHTGDTLVAAETQVAAVRAILRMELK